MPGGDRFANKLRKALGEIADDKTGRRRITLRQELQQAVKVPLQPALQAVPFGRRRLRAGPRQVEPVFHVDGEDTVAHDPSALATAIRSGYAAAP